MKKSSTVKRKIKKLNSKKTLEAFLEAWLAKDYEAMTKRCNITWVIDGWSFFATATDFIKASFMHLELKEYKIGHIERIGEAMMAYPVEVRINTRKATFKANVLCEIAPYSPDVLNGTWGVNPVSVTQIKWIG